ncbi:hypothetical protein HPG69_014088 [Diceros bicornis minor]|uniref:Uncharacterized protein n=1 Tax=Diceros bicornis minor TaxID=77932 RepID=A0A7J7EMZ4_DICBM|nr:hypothetical protein HPG69_014088 [Diceros bicornis minor]
MCWTPRGGARTGAGGRALRAARTIKWDAGPAAHAVERVVPPGLEQPRHPSLPWQPPAGSPAIPTWGTRGHGRESAGACPGGRGERCYRYTRLPAISRRFKQNPNELAITWVLRVCDQGALALSLSSGELVLLGDLAGDAVFNCRCKGLPGGCEPLLAWLLQAWHRRWESFRLFEATELPFRPWTTMEEGIQLVRELGMVD